MILRSKRTHRPIDGFLLVGLAVAATFWTLGCSPSSSGHASISPDALEDLLGSDDAPFVLDVRTTAEFDAGHIPGAVNVPHDQLANRLDELPSDHDAAIVVHCQSGKRAAMAEEVLADAGYSNVSDLEGHWASWSGSGRPTE